MTINKIYQNGYTVYDVLNDEDELVYCVSSYKEAQDLIAGKVTVEELEERDRKILFA